jgi:hypothetical protein
VIPERRSLERRTQERRQSASESVDVTRIEHENLFNQVQQNEAAIRRLETELRRMREALEALRLKAVS